jgi:hypothetical protein
LPNESLLSDQLVHDLMAVGQVDVLVAVPTLDNAATIQAVIRAVSDAFARYFPRDRTLLLNSDGGSRDDTPALVRTATTDDSGTVTVRHRLRTEHRISTPYHGLPGKGSALRQIMTVADLTQARAVAVLAADVASVTPEWIAALIRPVRDQQYDYVAPVYLRHPADGPLVSQIVRPLVRATYGWQVDEPLAAEFGCSGRFLSYCLEQNIWESELARYGMDLWITGAALAGGFRCCQAPLGPRVVPASADRPAFPELFRQVVGATFECLELHAPYWLGRSGSEKLPIVGAALQGPPDPPAIDAARLTQSFAADLRDLHGVLETLLSPETLAALDAVAAQGDPLRFPDDLWVTTVYEFLIAHQRDVMRREHIERAMVPLYLGRTGSFLLQYGAADPTDVDAALESLGLRFEQAKPDVVTRWNQTVSR